MNKITSILLTALSEGSPALLRFSRHSKNIQQHCVQIFYIAVHRTLSRNIESVPFGMVLL